MMRSRLHSDGNRKRRGPSLGAICPASWSAMSAGLTRLPCGLRGGEQGKGRSAGIMASRSDSSGKALHRTAYTLGPMRVRRIQVPRSGRLRR